MIDRQDLNELEETVGVVLMDTANKGMPDSSQVTQSIFHIYDEPVMKVAIDLIEKLGKFGKITLKAKGDFIPNAVSVSNILAEKMMRGNILIEKIKLDSDIPKQLGRMISTIEIILVKK